LNSKVLLDLKDIATISSRNVATGSILTSSLDDISGSLSFATDGSATLPLRPLALRLVYGRGGPFNLLGHDAIELDLSLVVSVLKLGI